MKDKKEISTLLKHITEGDYAKGKENVKNIIESKISGRISQINRSK